METELFGVLLGAMGSIASLISLIFSIAKGKESIRLSVSLLVIVCLTGTSSYFSYKYYEVTQPEYIKAKKIENLKASAKAFVEQHPSFRSYWKAGENEGIAKSGVIVLEMHKDLFPDNYKSIKADIEKDISYSKKHRDQAAQRQSLEAAAQTIYSTMKTLAGS